MAKRTAKTNKTAKVIAASAVVNDEPVEGIPLNSDGIRLDVTLTMADLAKMVRTDAREVMLAERGEVMERLNVAVKAHADISRRMQEVAVKAVEALKLDPAAQTLASALSGFTGEVYTVSLDTPAIDIGEAKVYCNVSVSRNCDAEAINSGRYYGSSFQLRKRLFVGFTPEMNALLKDLQEAAEKANDIRNQLDKANHRLADLPNLVDRAESALMKAYLAKKLNTGADMLSILSAVQTKSTALLPSPQNS